MIFSILENICKNKLGAITSSFDDTNYCRMYQGSEQTISDSVLTTINLDTVTYDPSSMCDTINHKITIKETALYQITFFSAMTSTDACNISFGLLKNAEANNLMQTTYPFPADDLGVFLSGLASLTLDDYLTPKIYIWNCTGTFKIYATSRNTYLEVIKVRNA